MHLLAAVSSCSPAPMCTAPPQGLHDGRLGHFTLLRSTCMTDLPCCAEAVQEAVEPRSGHVSLFSVTECLKGVGALLSAVLRLSVF